MGLKDREYMPSEPDDEELPPRRPKVWVVVVAVLLVVSFLLSTLAGLM